MPHFTNRLVSFHELACFIARTRLSHPTNRLASPHEPPCLIPRADLPRSTNPLASFHEPAGRNCENAKGGGAKRGAGPRESAKSDPNRRNGPRRFGTYLCPFRVFAPFRAFAVPSETFLGPRGPRRTSRLASFHESPGLAAARDLLRFTNRTCLTPRMRLPRFTNRPEGIHPALSGSPCLRGERPALSASPRLVSYHELTGVIVGLAPGHAAAGLPHSTNRGRRRTLAPLASFHELSLPVDAPLRIR